MLKNIVLGLDGATFDLLNPWIEDGVLPNIKKLIAGGTNAVMVSCLPPVTCPNWKCYSTGKGPGKLGIFWWEKVDVNNRTIESVRYADHVKSKEIWDLMNDRGYRTAVINMPTTYPPKEIKGCMIAGGPDCPNKNFTYPKELERELKDKFGYKIRPAKIARLRSKDTRAVSEVLKQIQRLFAVTNYLMGKNYYDFIHLTVFCISFVQHFLWDDEIVKEIWSSIDWEIGNLLSELPEGCGVIIMSDHGMREVSKEFYINKWLEEKGYLVLKEGTDRLLSKRTSYKKGLVFVEVLKKIRLKEVFKKILPFKRYILGPNVFVGGIGEEKAKRIDWDKSRVIASGQGPLYLIGSKDGSDYEDLRDEVIASLRGLKDPETEKHIVEKIHRKEEVYPLVLTDNAPDIVLEPETSYRINGEIGDTPVFVNCCRWAAENDPPGIFIAYGKDIKALNKLPNINITDLAPTILHWMDIPVPEDMDGRIMKEIFKKDSNPYRREIKRCKSDDLSDSDCGGYNKEEEKIVQERLKELGYLG